MNKIFTKSLFLIAIFSAFAFGPGFAQTITVGTVDPGPYAPGSTISIPISVTGTCVNTTTTYNLYLSDAAGSFAAQKLIGNFPDFYATFVNGIIPAGTPAGSGYKLKVVSVNPAATSTISGAFSISAGTAVLAGVSSQPISAAYPEVFGTCSGTNNTSYSFVNASSTGAAVTATFFNELTMASEGSITPTAAGANFTAKAAQYTVTVKATAGGIVGTKSYFLINNAVNTSISVNGSSTICLNSGAGSLSYNVDITSAGGIQNNFPGVIYTIKWGDGTTQSLTLCNIVAANGTITHSYQKSSCGNSPNGQSNSFQVDIQPSSVYCGKVGTQVTSYAKVIIAPTNTFVSPIAACNNTPVTFVNTSDPGQDPNVTSAGCKALNALYSWVVDGVTAASNYAITKNFTTTFTTTGTHTITLHLQNGSALCNAADVTQNICIQNPPQPKFTLPTLTGCAPATITPTNQSIIDANCNASNTYLWTVTGPSPITFANGTTASSAQPQFVFSGAGIYQIQLGITTASCGTVTAPAQTVVIDAPISISLSPDANLCGTNQTYTFGPNPGPTKTTISTAAQPQPNTYTWTVTGGTFSFAGGTTANSQYPQITFTAFATYKVSVTVQDNCGTKTLSQNLTFQNAPSVNIVPSATTICPGSPVTLKATIVGAYNSFSWSGNGTFSAPGSLTTNYTPTGPEISAGSATITINVKTSLAGQCANIQQNVTVNIFPVNTITGVLTGQTCTGSAVNYSINSSVPASTFSWTAALTSGNATGFANGSGPVINDVLKNNGPGNAVVSYTITPVANGCQGTPSVIMITVKPQSTATAKPVNNSICSGSAANITLTPSIIGTTYTWTSIVISGSITGNSQQASAGAAAAINDVLTNNGATAGSVKYTVTPFNGSCAGLPVTATITVQPPPVAANAGANDEVCNVTSYLLSGNNPAPGTGKWTVSPATGVSFNNATLATATASGLIAGNIYTFTWTITPGAPCAPSSSQVVITDDAPSKGGTTSGGTTVCTGGNSGTITLAGQIGKVTGWESSIDNGVTWQAILPVNTTTTQQYTNLTATTQYRADVQNGLCSTQTSTTATVVVNQPTMQAIAGPDQNLCGATTATLQGNNPAPFAGVWTQTAGPVATIVSPNNALTQVTGLVPGNNYTFIWTIKGLPPCPDNSDPTHIHDANDVIASFTPDKTNGCGAYSVIFNNTSTVLTGTSFLWVFGDGSQSTAVSPTHQFNPSTDGKDTVYTVSLFVVNNCFQRPPFTVDITVRPQTPIAYISPLQIVGCSPFTLAVNNFSPGNNQSYDYYLNDANGKLVQKITRTNTNQIQFNPITVSATQQYSLYMVATGFCGNVGQTNVIPITISVTNLIAQMFPVSGIAAGCAPFTATFVNNSLGGDNYYYTIYDVNHNVLSRPVGGTAPLPYVFNTSGTFYVSITATNSCSILESPLTRFDVYPVPSPQFVADVTTGCQFLTVSFTNQTPNDPSIPASSLQYDWDFGDGSPHAFAFTPPPHLYNYKNSPFNVKLTATNPATNCASTITRAGYIDVTSPPGTNFAEKPDSITSIPNYSFNFINQTTGNPTTFNWSFGDGQSSTSQEPRHTYIDTGIYKVTLTASTKSGCDSTISHNVRITGIPGQIYLPNAFEPDGASTELKTFTAKGSGIKEWHMQIFNNYAQLIWETTKLDAKGAPIDGWDGTFKGAPAPQGVYIWQVSATFINGTAWKGNVIKNSLPKRTGTVHLIR